MIVPKVGDVVVMENGRKAVIVVLGPVISVSVARIDDPGIHFQDLDILLAQEPIGKMHGNHIIPMKPCMRCAHSNRKDVPMPTSVNRCKLTGECTTWDGTCEKWGVVNFRNYPGDGSDPEAEHKAFVETATKVAPVENINMRFSAEFEVITTGTPLDPNWRDS